MKTDGYVDRSLDDFIKANRGMFRRGRGGAGATRGAALRGGRGRGRGQSRGSARGRSSSRGAARGGRGSSRGGRGNSRGGSGSSRGASRGRGRAATRGATRGTARGTARGANRGTKRGATRVFTRGQGATTRSASGTRGSFGQRWRAASARMGRHLESAAPAVSPLTRKQLAVKAVRSSKLAGRLGTPTKGVKRLTTLALKKKRQAVQQLTSSKQLSRADARNQILMKRRGLTPATVSPARRGRGAASRGATAARRPPLGRLQVIHETVPAAAPFPLRRPLNRTRITAGTVKAPGGAASLLTVQFKNDIAVRQRRAPPPLDMDMDEDMSLAASPSPPPPPPPPPPPRTRDGLDPRIQQEIAAIQARGRSQHHLPAGGQSSGVSNFRPTAATSSRTLNDRFTADRVIFS